MRRFHKAMLMVGLVLILVMIFQPRGLQEPLTKAYTRLLDRFPSRDPQKAIGGA